VDKSMEQMFASCWQLQTIIVGSHWTTYYTENTQDMFKDCMNLVGSAGTTYDANHTDGTYAHADGGTKYPGYLTYKGPYAVYADGTLTFYNDTERGSRSGKTYDLNEGDNMPDWVNVRFEVTSVVFDPSFAKARPTSTREWFSSMTSLESITGMTKYLNTSEVTTMVSMFFNCSILTTLDLSGFDTRNVAHMDYMFYNSRALTTIYVSGKWSTENLTSSDYMFYNCESLVGGEGTVLDQNHLDATYAHIDGGTANPGYLTLKLEAYAEYVQNPGTTDKTDSGVSGTLTFYYDANRSQHTGTVYDLNEGSEMPGWYTDNNCRNVTSVVFDPSFADARPTTGFRWFSSMSALESITGMKEYLNTSKMTSMTCMFEYCRGLKTLDLSSFDTRNVQDMVDMFNGCVSLKELDLSSFDTRNVTSMNRMFYGCQRLEWLNVGSFNTQNVRSMEGMFGQCMSLTDLDLRSFNTSNVTKMDVMFIYCYELVKVYVGDGWNVDNVGDTYDMFYSCNNILGMRGTAYDADHTGSTYAHIDEGTGNPGYLSLMPYAVYRENRKSLTFYNDDRRSQRQEPTYDLGSGYQGPGWWVDNYTYTEINRVTFDQTFQYARPNSTYGWFAYMENLEEIIGIEYLNTSNVKCMRAMFYNCKNLMDVDLSYFDTRNVTDMNDMFNNCSNLTRLDLSSFDTRNVTDMTGMFYLCQALDSINVSSFDTQNVENMWAMFAGCYYLRELDLSSFDTRKVKNMTQMFYDDSRLKTITVGQGWSTKAVTESGWMFYGCWNLVGGAGTVYDENHIDAEYAHVDGGPSNPGYLTLTQNIPMGDVNLDGQVGIGDIVAITNVMAGIETNPTIIIRADVNGDGQVGIGDIVAITNIMAGI
jgi:surface protein